MRKLVLYGICLIQAHIYSVYAEITDTTSTCSEGWFGFGDKCYKLGGRNKTERLNWENAQKFCKEEYNGDLVTVYSQEMQDFMTAFFVMSAQSNIWIGLHDRERESDYKWADGSAVLFTSYQPYEPSGIAHSYEDCFEMDFKKILTKPGEWNDVPCYFELPFVCQRAKDKFASKRELDPRYCTSDQGTGWRFGNSCFYVVDERKDWSEAEQFCNDKYKGHLATIDYRVNEYLKYVLRDVKEQMWIGVKLEEGLQQKWSSGWLVSFENWELQGSFMDETCLLRESNSSWRIQFCEKKLWFLCEYSTDTPPVFTPSVEGSHCPHKPKGWRDFGGDLCYFFDEQAKVSWHEANFNCMRRGGTLVSMHSKEELNALFQFFRYLPRTHGYIGIYIGLYRLLNCDKEFAWTDGSEVDYTYWGKGESQSETDQCTDVSSISMHWNDINCSDRKGYICSIHKITPNLITPVSLRQTSNTNGISITSLIGVIICVLVFSLVIGLSLYHFKLCDRGYDRVKRLYSMRLQTSELDKKSRNRSEELVTNDVYFENID